MLIVVLFSPNVNLNYSHNHTETIFLSNGHNKNQYWKQKMTGFATETEMVSPQKPKFSRVHVNSFFESCLVQPMQGLQA